MDDVTEELMRHIETALMLPLCLLAVFIIHELGHYLAAKALGLKVESVSFGYGRALWSHVDRWGTHWRLFLWPIRAHVQIADFDRPDVLSMRKKLFVILAGPAANLIVPALLFFLFFATFGKPVIPTIVTAIEPTMPAYKAGLRPGDRIVSIDGETVQSMEDITDHTRPRPVRPLAIVYNRHGKSFETSVLPVWVRYRDIDGTMRSHGRIGLSTWQQAYKLSVVRSVNGIRTKSVEEARAALLAHMDERVEVGLWSMDSKVYTSLIDLSSQSNPHLADLDHRESRRFYMGAMRDNLYLPLTLPQSAAAGLTQGAEMVWHMALLPFNLFPIDKEWITPEAVVSGQTSYLRARLYIFIFFTSLCSCFIGLVNLLPFPRLDGGALLLMVGEAWKRRPLATKERAALLVFSLLFFYAAVFGANAGDMRHYYMFQMQKANAAEAR